MSDRSHGSRATTAFVLAGGGSLGAVEVGTGTDELIERAAKSTKSWLERGGHGDGAIPGELLPHSH